MEDFTEPDEENPPSPAHSQDREPYAGCAPTHRDARRTEIAAAARIDPYRATLRMRVLAWIKEAGDAGLTAEEGGAKYAVSRGRHPLDGSSRYSVAPRIRELCLGGLAKDSGKARGGFIAWVCTGADGDGRVVTRVPEVVG